MKRIFTSAAVIISNAVNLLAGSKSQVTPAPKPTVTLSYKRMNTDVTLKSGLTGAVIYYTLDGSTPTTGSTVYTEPFNVTAETTVKAVVIADGYLLSDVAEQVVDLKDQALEPTIDVAYEPGRATVTISGADEEAEIWFNLTGSNDPARSQRYTEPVVLTSSATDLHRADMASRRDSRHHRLQHQRLPHLLCRGHPHRARRADRHQHRQPPVVLPTDRLHPERTAGGKGRPKGDLHH